MAIIFGTREEWLEEGMSELSTEFVRLGQPLPPRIRVTCGFTSGGTRKRKGGKTLIGECWDSTRSGDATFEVMISPVEDDPVRVLGILTHELCHAAAGLKAGHGPAFGVLARGMKLEGSLTATTVGIPFETLTAAIRQRLGDYPHAKLDTSTRKVQTTRMLRCVCSCGYTVRLSAKWIKVGLPHCPLHGPMAQV